MRKALTVLTPALILSLAVTPTVAAQSPTPTPPRYVYTAQDSGDQISNISGIENYVFWLPFQLETVYYSILDNGDASL